MRNLKKYLLALLLLVVAFTFVACGEEPEKPVDDTPVDTTVKITEIKVFPTIYDGEEESPYVLVGEEMYVEAELNDGATEVETWEIDNQAIAKMELNPEGGVILTGLKAGSAIVTAKNPDGSIKDSLTIEVCTSKNAQDVLIAANAEIVAAFPKYIAANTKLPVPENPNVVIKYKDSISNGIKVVNGEYQYDWDENKGDVNKQISFTLSYHGAKLDSNTYFYEVKDAEKNIYRVVENVEKKIQELFAPYITPDANGKVTPVTESFTGDKAFPSAYTAEEVGEAVTLVWTSNQTSSISNAGVYKQGDVDKAVVLSCAVYNSNKDLVSKLAITVIAAGATPDDIINYFVSQKYCPADGSTVTTTLVKFASSDASKKYPGLSVEWSCDNEAAKWVESKSSYTLAASGEYTFTGVFYYNKGFLFTYLPLNGKEAPADQIASADSYCTYVVEGVDGSVDFKSNTAYAADAVVYSTIYGKYYKVKSAIAAEDNDSFKAIETNLAKVEVAESEESANYAVGTAYAVGDVICQTVKRYYKVDSAVSADSNGGFNTVRAKLSKVNAESATGAKEYKKAEALAAGAYLWREVKLYYKVNSAITAEANTGFSAIESSLTEVILSSNTKYSLDYEAATTYVDDDYVKVTSSGEYYRVATYIKAEYNSGFWAINSALTEIPGAWKMNGEAIKLSDYGVGSEEAPRTPRNGDIIMFTISYSWKEVRTFTVEK